MKSIFFSLLIFLGATSAFSQNSDWDLFPNGALRYMEGPIDNYELKRGIDFRDFSTDSSLETTIELSRFTKFRRLDVEDFPEYEYISDLAYLTGNSILGNRIVKEEKHTHLLVLNDSNKNLAADTFTLLNSGRIGETWKCYEDSFLLITAENKSLTKGFSPDKQDSIRTIAFTTLSKSTGKNLVYFFDAGKEYGFIRFVDIGEFIKYHHSTFYTAILDLLPWKERTKTEFFKIKPKTEIQKTSEPSQIGGYFVRDYYKEKFYERNDSLLKDVIHVRTKDLSAPGFITIFEKDTTTSEYVIQKDTGQEFFNPILSFTDMLDSNFTLRYDYGKYCDSAYWVNSSICTECGSWERVSEDTIVFPLIAGNSELRRNIYYSGIGLTEKTIDRIATSREVLLETQFFSTGECAEGKQYQYLNSVSTPLQRLIKTYPNPASSYISLGDLGFLLDEVQVYNLMGMRVNAEVIGTNKLDVSDLTSGIYFLQFYKDNVLYRSKFVKE